MYKWCAVPLCNNTSIKTPSKLFVYVPDKITMRNKWLTLARRDPAALSLNSRLYFCEDHFDLENDMENYIRWKVMGSVQQIRMKPQCVPSRFDCQADEKNKTTSSDPCLAKRGKKYMIKNMDQDLEGEENKEVRPPTGKQAPKPFMLAPSTMSTGFQDTYIQSLLKTSDDKIPEQSKQGINIVPGLNKSKSRCNRPNRTEPILKKARKNVTQPVTTGYVPNIVRRYNIENLKLTEEFKGIFCEILKVLTVDTNTIAITDLVRAVNENESLRADHKSLFTWDDDIYELLEQTCDYKCIVDKGLYYIVVEGFITDTPDCGAKTEAPHSKDDVECELQMKIELEEETFTPGTNTNVGTIDSGHLFSADRVKVEIEEDAGTNTDFTSFDSYLPYAGDCMVKIEGDLPDHLDGESSLPAERNNEKPDQISLPANGDVVPPRLRPVHCFVPECRSNSREFPDKLYFTVPLTGNLRAKWLKVVGRDTNSTPLSLKCCSDHFDLEKDTERSMRNKNRGEDVTIKKGVLPHKFECQQRTKTPVPCSDEVDKPTNFREANYGRGHNALRITHCFVPVCKSNSKACPDKTFFVVPVHKKIREKWMKAVGCPLYKKSKLLTCCSDHFDLSTDIEEQGRKSRQKYPTLKKGVLPHKCLHRKIPIIKKNQLRRMKPVHREIKEIMEPVAEDKNMAEFTGSTDTASERGLDNCFSSDDEIFDKTSPDGEPKLNQCSSCSDFISDMRLPSTDRSRSSTPHQTHSSQGPSTARRDLLMGLALNTTQRLEPPSPPRIQALPVNQTPGGSSQVSGDTVEVTTPGGHLRQTRIPAPPLRPPTSVVQPMLCVRYCCLQCSWWLCVVCEARGLHKQHCVVRATSYNFSLDPVEIRSMMRNLKRILQNNNLDDNDDWRMNAAEDDVEPDMSINDVPTVTTTEFYNGFQEEDIPYEEIITGDKETVFNESSMTQPQHPFGTHAITKIPLTNAITKETEQNTLKRPQGIPIVGQSSAEEDIKKSYFQQEQVQNKELVFKQPQVLMYNPRSLPSKTSTVTRDERYLIVTSGPAQSINKIVSSKASPEIQDTSQPSRSFANFINKDKEYRMLALSPGGPSGVTVQSGNNQPLPLSRIKVVNTLPNVTNS